MKVTIRAASSEKASSFMLMSFCVRSMLVVLPLLPFSSFPASPTAFLMMGHDLMMPITPDMAIPPMPM